MGDRESDLLQAVARGDRDAFATLYDRYASRLLGLVVKILGNRQEAEDVLQDVFQEIWRRADRYDPKLGTEAMWLLTLTRFRTLDLLRRRGAMSAREADAARAAVMNDLPDEPSEPMQSARAGLEKLPAEQRDAIGLAFFHGLTSQQVARVQEVPHATAKTRIRLGMRKLREYLHPMHEGLSA